MIKLIPLIFFLAIILVNTQGPVRRLVTLTAGSFSATNAPVFGWDNTIAQNQLILTKQGWEAYTWGQLSITINHVGFFNLNHPETAPVTNEMRNLIGAQIPILFKPSDPTRIAAFMRTWGGTSGATIVEIMLSGAGHMPHEFGHTYGASLNGNTKLSEGNSWICGTYASCFEQPYGDHYSVMGQYETGTPGPKQMKDLGWLTGGAYTIQTVGIPSVAALPIEYELLTAGIKALEIPTSGGTYYIIKRTSGVKVYRNLLLLDLNITTSVIDYDLDNGQTYSDSNITISRFGSFVNVS